MTGWFKELELSKRVIPWVNDHVIISNRFEGHYNVHGVITGYIKGYKNYYQVDYIYNGVSHTVQICTDESIEMDVQYYRDLKLNELGI